MAAEPMRSGVSECPDLETLAAYLDGRVAGDARAGISEHLATCESCYFVFLEAAQIKVATAPPAAPWWKNRRIVLPAATAGLAVAATLVLAVSGIFSTPSSNGPELEALVAAVGSERIFEPRLTGGFAYGPLRTVRGAESPVQPSPDIRIAAASLERDTVGERSPEALRERGIAFLVTGDVERAVAALEEAAAGRAEDARILNDLAAAYLVRAERKNQPEDLSRAIASANRAMAANHLLTEALYNRAYALQRLALVEEARDAWRTYLRLDTESGWAEEARTHLRALSSQP